MAKYKRKPEVVEAIQFTGAFSIEEMTKDWGKEFTDQIVQYETGQFFINTLLGQFHLIAGDWITKGFEGRFYVCKSDAFIATYKKVERSTLSKTLTQ